MFAVYRTLSLRYLRRRWFRAILIVASIALGVGTLVATRALNETMTRAGLNVVNPFAEIAQLTVSNGESYLSRDLAKELEKIEGVESVQARIFEMARLPDHQNRAVLVIGIDMLEETKGKQDREGLDLKLSSGTEAKLFMSEASNMIITETFKQFSGVQDQVWERVVQVALVLSKIAEIFGEAVGGENGETLKQVSLALEKAPEALNKTPGWLSHLPETLQQVPVVLGKELDNDLPPLSESPYLKVRKAGHTPVNWVRVGSIAEAKGPAASLTGQVLVVKLEAAAQLAGIKPGMVSRLDITLVKGADPKEVKQAVADRLQGRGRVYTPEEQNQAVGNPMSGMQTGFSLGGLAVLVVGMFLVYNSLSVSVAERRHEIGILLALGATRQQIRWLFAGEAAILGLCGAVLGIPLGMVLAAIGLEPVQDILRDVYFAVNARQVEIKPDLMFLAVFSGVATAVAASLVPAIQAARENPAEAVRRIPKIPTWRHRFLQLAASVILILGGVACIWVRRDLPFLRLGTYGGLVLVLLGTLLVAPLLAALAAYFLQRWAKGFFPFEGRLALDNLVRAPGRTGLVVAALAAGVALFVQTAGTILSNRIALREWVRSHIPADLVITSGNAIGTSGQILPMESTLSKEIEKIEGVEKVLGMRQRRFLYEDTQVLVYALNGGGYFDIIQKHDRKVKSIHLFKRLSEQPNGAVISDNFAKFHRVGMGDTVTLTSPAGPVHLVVVGQFEDYSWNHGTLYLNENFYLDKWVHPKVDIFDTYILPGYDADAIKSQIGSRLGGQYQLEVLTRAELQDRIDAIIERVYGIAYAQQVLVMMVAALGVVTALLISVLQRRREIGLLRAIGASRLQVIRCVLAEAALIGILGTALGLLVGIPLEWYVLEFLILEESGYLFPLYVPWLGALIIGGLAIGTATLAGLFPAVHAARQRIPEAIAYE